MRFEVTNIILKKIGKSQSTTQLLVRRLSDFLDSPLEICEVDQGETLSLALAARLAAYDASYLWLARQRKCGLVTLDRQLARIAQELLPS